jgi:hypothetical protein
MTTAVRLLSSVPAILALCSAALAVPRAAGADPSSPAGGRSITRDNPPTPPYPPLPDSSPIPGLPSLPPRVPDDGRRTEEGGPVVTRWDSLHPGDRERRKLLNKTEGEWGALTSETVLRAPEPSRETPFERGEWSTEDTLKIPVTGPLALFGQAVLVGDYAADQDMKVVGRTGVICKLPVWEGTALELRGGPAVKYNDALRPDKTHDQASVLLEVKATMPLSSTLGLEYLGEALPALTPIDRPRLNQDLGFAIPVSGGKLKLGAKHRWDYLQTDTRPSWTTNMEVYVGVEIGR